MDSTASLSKLLAQAKGHKLQVGFGESSFLHLGSRLLSLSITCTVLCCCSLEPVHVANMTAVKELVSDTMV